MKFIMPLNRPRTKSIPLRVFTLCFVVYNTFQFEWGLRARKEMVLGNNQGCQAFPYTVLYWKDAIFNFWMGVKRPVYGPEALLTSTRDIGTIARASWASWASGCQYAQELNSRFLCLCFPAQSSIFGLVKNNNHTPTYRIIELLMLESFQKISPASNNM